MEQYVRAAAQVKAQDPVTTAKGVRIREGVAQDRRISIEDEEERSTSEAQEAAASAPAETSASASQQPRPADGPAAKKRDLHGRRKTGIIAQVFIDMVPPGVQLEGLKHFAQIGAEESAVVGYLRGGPMQVAFPLIKIAPIGSTESNDIPAGDATTVPPAQSCERSDHAQGAPAGAAGSELEPSTSIAGTASAGRSELEPTTTVCQQPQFADDHVDRFRSPVLSARYRLQAFAFRRRRAGVVRARPGMFMDRRYPASRR